MAKGSRCPSCGELTMQKKKSGGVSECSSCHCVGWWKQPGSPGGGKGATCKSCDAHQLHTIYNGKFTIRYCTNSSCGATIIS